MSTGGPSRRSLLRAGGAALIGSRFATILRFAPAEQLGRIGIQLYTVRRAFQDDPEQTLARLAEIGFREVEAAGYPPGSPEEFQRMLRRHGLTIPSSHVGLPATDADWERVLDVAATLGQKFVVVPSIGGGDRQSVDDWKRVATRFNRAGEAAAKRGLTFCYHNHDFEFHPMEGLVPYDVLLSATDPKLVKLEMDLYWVTKAGKDPVDYFDRWPGRFPMVHVKDMDATPRKFFADAGTGIIDFPAIFRRARKAGIVHYFYEQDVTPGDPFASAAASFKYLRELKY